MARRRSSDVHSPVLSIDEVKRVLTEGLAALGSVGGSMGGAIGGGPAGALGGASGGRAGAPLGAWLTRLDGEERTLRFPRTEANLQRARQEFFGGNAMERIGEVSGAGEDAVLMAGLVGSGAASMNPCVVQAVWSAHEVHVTAHANEGLIKQRTCARALQRFGDVVSPGG